MQMATEQGTGGARDPLAGTAYTASHVIGRGASGTVYAARHRRLGKRVCVKLVHPELAGSGEVVDRMRIEAQAMAALDGHPNLLMVSDLGETPSGQPFLVTERLHGRTLAEERRQRVEMPVDEAIALALQLLAGLGAAHAQGIVHRDIKPANLFVCDLRPGETQRVLKILDFGILKMVAAAPAARAIAPAAAPTEAGVAIGTPRYFAPEQATGMAVDARADLHAVGAVLYGLIAGRGPFDQYEDLSELVRAIAFHAAAPPSAHAQQPIPAWLDRVLLRALEKRPARRFQTAEELADALRRGAAAQPARWDRTHILEESGTAPAARPSAPPATPTPTSVLVPVARADASPIPYGATVPLPTLAVLAAAPRAPGLRALIAGLAVAVFVLAFAGCLALALVRAWGAP
jgi:serine/threonine-protein kinase